MLRNPFYYVLKQRPDLEPIESIEQKSFYKLPLHIEAGKPLLWRGRVYRVSEHHLSVYQEYNPKRAELSPLHYTSTYREDKAKIKLHVYFDKFGQYLMPQIKMDEDELRLNNAEKSFLKAIAEEALGIHLTQLINEHQIKAKCSKDNVNKILAALEQESIKGMHSDSYIALLKEAIQILSEDVLLEFYPDAGLQKFLSKLLMHLDYESSMTQPISPSKSSKKIAKKKCNKNKHAAMLECTERGTEPVPTSLALPSRPQTYLDEKNREHGESADVFAQENILCQELEDCSALDINKMLSIYRKLDKFKMRYREIVIQACIEGNLTVIKRYLTKRVITAELMLVLSLLSTCVYHNQYELFDYVYHKIKNYFFVRMMYCDAFTESNPIKTAPIFFPSLLGIAYARQNLDFFKKLLKKYSYKPLVFDYSGINMLHHLAGNPDHIEYLLAFLDAGADPDLIHLPAKYEFIDANTRTCLAPPLKLVKLQQKSSEISHTALYQAVLAENELGVRTLLEAKADSHRKDASGFTAFGVAVAPPNKKHPNENIIKLFLNAQRKHSIDERQTRNQVTGLYFACQNNQLKAGRLLLSFNANPLAAHETKLDIDGAFKIVVSSPLLCALLKDNDELVCEILKHKKLLSAAGLISTIKQCQSIGLTIPKLLLTTCFLHCKQEGDREHKQEEFAKAELLYKHALGYTEMPAEKQIVFYNLATCLEKANKTDEAEEMLKKCISIRRTLASNPISHAAFTPLLQKAEERLAHIQKSKHCASPNPSRVF